MRVSHIPTYCIEGTKVRESKVRYPIQWNRVLIEKLIFPHLVTKFPTFYRIPAFIPVLTRPCHEPDESDPCLSVLVV